MYFQKICQANFHWKCTWMFFPPNSPKKSACFWTFGFLWKLCHFLGSGKNYSFQHSFNSTWKHALNQSFCEECLLKKCFKIDSSTTRGSRYPWFEGFFFQTEIGNWCWGATKQPRPLNTTQSEDVTLFFPHIVLSTTPTHRYVVLSPVLLASRDQDGSPLNSTINIYDLMEK